MMKSLFESLALGVLVVAAFLALLGCTGQPTKRVDAHCLPLCTTACEDLTGWDGTRDSERLTALMDLHDSQHAECDTHRQACVTCLETARKAGAIQ